jgi:hypothetical protein
MVRDVYRSDDALLVQMHAPYNALTAEFHIEADGATDVMCRVANVLRLANCPVTRGSLVNEQGDRTTIRVEMEEISLATVENLLRKLSQLTCVFESWARVTSPAPDAIIRVLRTTEAGIAFHDCQAPESLRS